MYGNEVCSADNVCGLPINRCVDDSNVTIDFRAVFKGVNVGGIDRQDVCQVSHAKTVTHCKPLENKSE